MRKQKQGNMAKKQGMGANHAFLAAETILESFMHGCCNKEGSICLISPQGLFLHNGSILQPQSPAELQEEGYLQLLDLGNWSALTSSLQQTLKATIPSQVHPVTCIYYLSCLPKKEQSWAPNYACTVLVIFIPQFKYHVT